MPESFVDAAAKADFLRHHDTEKARVAARASLNVELSSTMPVGESSAVPGSNEPLQPEPVPRPGLQPALSPQDFPRGETLCIGIDFAWWGGGRARRTQTDTLVFARINGEQADPLQLKRVDLSATYNRNAADTEPNCDPECWPGAADGAGGHGEPCRTEPCRAGR